MVTILNLETSTVVVTENCLNRNDGMPAIIDRLRKVFIEKKRLKGNNTRTQGTTLRKTY